MNHVYFMAGDSICFFVCSNKMALSNKKGLHCTWTPDIPNISSGAVYIPSFHELLGVEVPTGVLDAPKLWYNNFRRDRPWELRQLGIVNTFFIHCDIVEATWAVTLYHTTVWDGASLGYEVAKISSDFFE
jgi:hypothetical protein